MEVKRRFYRRPGCLAPLVLLLLGLGYFVWVAIIDVCPYWEFYDDGLQQAITQEGPLATPVEFMEIRLYDIPKRTWYCPEELERFPLVYSSTDLADIAEFLSAVTKDSTVPIRRLIEDYALLFTARDGKLTVFNLGVYPGVVSIRGISTRLSPFTYYMRDSTSLFNLLQKRGIIAPSGEPLPSGKRP